jgi:hypothetical protein
MEINKKYKLEKAVSKDPLRESLQNIFITQRHAIATNGHILAIVPVKSEDTDRPGILSVVALKLGRKAMPKGFDEIILELNSPEKSILVRPLNDGNGERGLIMPMRIRE